MLSSAITLTRLSLLVLLLTACETAVEVDVPPHTPRLALTYTLSTQTPTDEYQGSFATRGLYVSTSQAVLDTSDLTRSGRNDATVQLVDEASGQVVEEFRPERRLGNSFWEWPGHYAPTRNFAGVPGGRYTLRASAPGVAPVEATLTLPVRPVIESARYVAGPPDPFSPGNFRHGHLSVVVADNAATADYYLVYVRVFDAQGRCVGQAYPERNGNSGVNPDPQFNRLALSYDNFSAIAAAYADQDGGNGQRLGLSTDLVLSTNPFPTDTTQSQSAPAAIEVVVSGITADTYRFYQSVQRQRDTAGNPFAEPAPLHSNVQGGYGLFGGATDAVVRVPL